MSLAELQRTFWTAIRNPGGSTADGMFVSRGRLDADARLAIYRDMYFFRQREALRDAFPVLARELGPRFRELADRYVLAHPSDHPALEWLGRELSSFVARTLADPILADVAALEWAHCRALLAPDPTSIANIKDVQLARFASARLGFVPSLFVLEVHSAALARIDPQHVLASERATVVYFRRSFRVFRSVLEPDEARCLELARGGAPIGAACEAFASASDPTVRGFEVLSAWFGRQWIETIREEPSQ